MSINVNSKPWDVVYHRQDINLLVEHNVGCLENRIDVQSQRDVFEQSGLLPELRQLSQTRHGGHRAEDPVELGVLSDGGLDEEGALAGIDAAGEQCGGHGEDVLAQKRRIVGHGDGVKIHDTDGYVVAGILQLHPLADGAQVVAQMQRSCGLDATEDLPRPAAVLLGSRIVLE